MFEGVARDCITHTLGMWNSTVRADGTILIILLFSWSCHRGSCLLFSESCEHRGKQRRPCLWEKESLCRTWHETKTFSGRHPTLWWLLTHSTKVRRTLFFTCSYNTIFLFLFIYRGHNRFWVLIASRISFQRRCRCIWMSGLRSWDRYSKTTKCLSVRYVSCLCVWRSLIAMWWFCLYHHNKSLNLMKLWQTLRKTKDFISTWCNYVNYIVQLFPLM